MCVLVKGTNTVAIANALIQCKYISIQMHLGELSLILFLLVVYRFYQICLDKNTPHCVKSLPRSLSVVFFLYQSLFIMDAQLNCLGFT